ncbi:MAG: PAS domain-containing protein, partial [Candidatus Kapaibacteriota bacterium]
MSFISLSYLLSLSPDVIYKQRVENDANFLLLPSIIFILVVLSIIFFVWFIYNNRKKTRQLQILLLNNEKQKKIIDKIFHTLPVGILITDFGGNILNINREFCNLFGLD